MPSLAVAIGLALQGLKASQVTINLLPDDFIIRRELRAKRFTGFVAAALIWGIIGCLWAKEKVTLSKLGTVEDAGKTTLASVTALDKKLKDAEAGEDPARLKSYKDFGTHREFYARIIDGISAAIPREYQVDQFNILTQLARTGANPNMMRRGPKTAQAAEAAGPNAAEMDLILQCNLVLTFTAMSPGDKEPTELTVELPKHLKEARIYPEQIEFIKGIFVEQPNVVMKGAVGPASSRRGAAAVAVGEASANYVPDKWRALITIGMIAPSDVDDLIKKAREAAAKQKAVAQKAEATAPDAPAPAAPAAPKAPAARGRAP